jgi:predicted  nucleic acid-binding Zn ribbon protein
MVTADIRFSSGNEEDTEAIEWLVSSWYKNGQVLEWQTAKTSNGLRILALLPKPNAIDLANNNVYAMKYLQLLSDRGVSHTTEIVGIDPEAASACCCAHRSSLVLFTTYMSKSSPVQCGDCFGPVPLYELPHVRDDEHLGILHWSANYQACDTLQMHCGTGERFGEGQLGRHDSSLSQEGREIAVQLSMLTDAPVYYFIMKVRGVSDARERRRLCPSCGGHWALAEAWHGLFDFKCDSCSLLSNIAYSLRW